MFIKIKNHSDNPKEISFTIIDNIDVINHFSPQPIKLTSIEEAKKLWNNLLHFEGTVLDTEWLYLIQVDKADKEELPSLENPYSYNILNFHRKGEDSDTDEQWAFDTVAYIMSDEGKTIDKVMAGGLYSTSIAKALAELA
jgi:hypothetical protein